MKTLPVLTLLSALMLTSGLAESPRPNANAANDAPAVATTPNNGFWLRKNVPVMTRNGVTTKIEADEVLPNGLRVQKNGTVTLRDGITSALQANRLLTFDGDFVALPAEMQAEAGTTPARGDVSRAERKEIGLSSRDGVTVSGTDVLITRNGVTDKITSDTKMPNGALVKPDGTIILANGQHIVLRPDQLLDLNGTLRESPVQPNPAGPAPSSSTPNQ